MLLFKECTPFTLSTQTRLLEHIFCLDTWHFKSDLRDGELENRITLCSHVMKASKGM